MRLHVETMDADLVEFNQNGKVRFAGEEWNMPTLQERRAILYAAQNKDQPSPVPVLSHSETYHLPCSR